ncbi:MAG: hypothetical protein AAF362_10000, partial [Pseudomonadota bacterium]
PIITTLLVVAAVSTASRKTTIVGTLFPQPVVEWSDGETVLLDSIIKNQGAVILFSEFPDKLLCEVQHAKLASIGIRLIGITPEWNKAVDSEIAIVRDVSRLLSSRPYSDYLDHAILLRPDKYVAATAPVNKIADLLEIAEQFSPLMERSATVNN